MRTENHVSKFGLVMSIFAIAALAVPLVAAAQTGVLFVKNNKVGIGVSTPTQSLHVRQSDGTASVLVEETNGTTADRTMFELKNNGRPKFLLDDGTSRWQMLSGSTFFFSKQGSGGTEFFVEEDGDMGIRGTLTVCASGTSPTCTPETSVPDYVFEPDYELMPLDELRTFIEQEGHLPKVPTVEDVKASGLNMTKMQFTLLEKVEELTLYTLAQQEQIDRLLAANEALRQRGGS